MKDNNKILKIYSKEESDIIKFIWKVVGEEISFFVTENTSTEDAKELLRNLYIVHDALTGLYAKCEKKEIKVDELEDEDKKSEELEKLATVYDKIAAAMQFITREAKELSEIVDGKRDSIIASKNETVERGKYDFLGLSKPLHDCLDNVKNTGINSGNVNFMNEVREYIDSVFVNKTGEISDGLAKLHFFFKKEDIDEKITEEVYLNASLYVKFFVDLVDSNVDAMLLNNTTENKVSLKAKRAKAIKATKSRQDDLYTSINLLIYRMNELLKGFDVDIDFPKLDKVSCNK